MFSLRSGLSSRRRERRRRRRRRHARRAEADVRASLDGEKRVLRADALMQRRAEDGRVDLHVRVAAVPAHVELRRARQAARPVRLVVPLAAAAHPPQHVRGRRRGLLRPPPCGPQPCTPWPGPPGPPRTQARTQAPKRTTNNSRGWRRGLLRLPRCLPWPEPTGVPTHTPAQTPAPT